MIVGLTGKKRHGKDTVGSILVGEHGFVRIAYADALKESAAALFDVPVGTWDELKNDPDAKVSLRVKNPPGYAARSRSIAGFSVREFLQRYGTEAHRNVFGTGFWIDVARGKMEGALADDLSVVVTDVRFDNEAKVIRDLGGLIVNIYRPQVVDENDTEDTHESEVLPEDDFTLWNGGTLDDLRKAITLGVGLGGRRHMDHRFADEKKED